LLGAGDAGRGLLQRIIDEVEAGACRPHLDRVFALDDIVAAPRRLEGDQAAGKTAVPPWGDTTDAPTD
jgi:NADPH:quinone reductase-like Zn-dependent oxidoreductase